MALQDLL
jgi:hypothetical protein